jgi:hypothetical protein
MIISLSKVIVLYTSELHTEFYIIIYILGIAIIRYILIGKGILPFYGEKT